MSNRSHFSIDIFSIQTSPYSGHNHDNSFNRSLHGYRASQSLSRIDRQTGERYGKRIAGVAKRWIEGAGAYQTEYIKEVGVADAKGWVAE